MVYALSRSGLAVEYKLNVSQYLAATQWRLANALFAGITSWKMIRSGILQNGV